MRVTEIITEAQHSAEIKQILLDKGYVFLGQGVDQMAFAEPGSNTVLKIYGTSEVAKLGELTVKQKSFKTFYDAVKADPTNEFLPKIYGYNLFNFNGKPYLQIRMERLFPFKDGANGWDDLLDSMAFAVEFRKLTATKYLNSLENDIENSKLSNDSLETLIMHLGTEGLTKMYKTIEHLYAIAKKNGYTLDLHGGNFMLDSDGNPVIVDPWTAWG